MADLGTINCSTKLTRMLVLSVDMGYLLSVVPCISVALIFLNLRVEGTETTKGKVKCALGITVVVGHLSTEPKPALKHVPIILGHASRYFFLSSLVSLASSTYRCAR